MFVKCLAIKFFLTKLHFVKKVYTFLFVLKSPLPQGCLGEIAYLAVRPPLCITLFCKFYF